MKILFSLLTALLPLTLFSQIYVDADASGAANGSSWADAYPLLENAIDAAQDGDEIWLTIGQYDPPIAAIDGTDTIRTWVIDKMISIHGSFLGTETSKGQRDLSFPTTIFNGDLLNNDDLENPFVNREDNARHLLFITDTVDNSTVIDGLYIINGTTLDGSGSGNNRRGGAILSYGSPIIENCYFQHCRGHYGSAVYPRGRGSAGTQIRDCSFLDNHATNAGAIYTITNSNILVENCRFKNNTSDGRAGAFYISSSDNSVVRNCSFEENTALTSTGGAIHCTSQATLKVENCSFKDNEAMWGGAVTVYQDGSVITVDSCEFVSNLAATSGGGMSVGFIGRANISNCSFRTNEGNFGGAIYLQNDSSQVHVSNSEFSSNTAQTNGGVFNCSAGATVSFTDCSMESNNAGNFGGALNLTEDSLDLLEVVIDRCSFISNIGSNQGGAINVSEGNVDIINSIFAFNDSNGAGRGGVLANNSGGTDNDGGSTVAFINCSMYANTGLEAGGISQWSPDGGNAVVEFTNTIMETDFSPLYFIEEGNPTVLSNGGNIVSDNTFSVEFTKSNDLLNTNPMFGDPFSLDFTPATNSPAIGNAIIGLTPAVDINGDTRSDMPESGAVEFDPISAVFNTNVKNATITISPTISSSNVAINLDDELANRTWTMSVFNQQGNTILSEQKVDQGELILNINPYANGSYYVRLRSNQEQFIGHFIKINK